MKVFTKNKLFWFITLVIIGIYVFTRLYNILGLPIFTDEAIYVRWAQIASNDAAWRFISLTDGKQPLYVWIAMVLMKVIEDPLLAGRVVSVLSGIGSMVGLFFLTNELFNPSTSSGQKRFGAWKLGLLASFIYVIFPFSLVYDRMALYDSLVSMFIIWALFFEILLVRHLRLDIALILGMIIGGGMLTKTNANFAFILLPFLLLLIDYKKRTWKKDVIKLAGLSLVALFIANAMYMILRLSPFFYLIEMKNYVFIYPFSEWVKHPFTYFFSNLRALVDWLVTYTTYPFLILVIASFLTGKKHFREKLVLLAWFIVPFVVSALFFKLPYPRHILFTTMPLIVLGAFGLYHLIRLAPKVWMKVFVPVVFLSMFVMNDYLILTNFDKAYVPLSDRGQFVRAWTAGVGVNETIAFLKEKSKNQKIYVATAGTFGLMPYALELYLVDNPNITIRGFWPIEDKIPQEVIDASREMPTYFVFYQDCLSCFHEGMVPVSWNQHAKIVFQIERIEKERYYTLYEITSQ